MCPLFPLLVLVLELSKNLHGEEIVVRILGGPVVAKLLVEDAGYIYKGPVRGFTDTYLLYPAIDEYPSHKKRGLDISKRLARDSRVLWAEPQIAKERQKRDLLPLEDPDAPLIRVKRIENKKLLRKPTPPKLDRTVNDELWSQEWYPQRDLLPLEDPNAALIRVKRFENKKLLRKPPPPKLDRTFNDELWSQEWYLQDTRTRPDLPKLDLNVLPVYRAGITGKGVRINILDDGIEHTHDDLKNNYDAQISWDCNEDDDDPLPRYEPTRQNSHGTRCAGEVAMKANNGKCGVGIAYGARIGGVKILDGLVNDRIEGTALGFAQHLVDIYSASWGPNDDGKTVDGPGRLAREAMKRGVAEGRNGRGSIYVWASGNGGSQGDNCNCDGYLASPYTISIGSASQKGEFPWYGEACASTLAVTYSSGAYQDQMIATTDLHNECTIEHTGTSASAPLAAGIIALALEVNQNLGWRDVQHLTVWTSELAPVAENPGWQLNGAGLWFNTRFGYGLMNAFGFVLAASNWTNVPERKTCIVKAELKINATISYNVPVNIPIKTTACRDTDQEINYLEHVEIITTIQYTIRGALEIHLTSPSGTKVEVLSPRKLDTSSQGFHDWSFMSVMTWGETAAGLWLLTVADNVGPKNNSGEIVEVSLRLHGTKELPHHMRFGPRTYNHNYNRVHNRVNVLEHEKIWRKYEALENLINRLDVEYTDDEYRNLGL